MAAPARETLRALELEAVEELERARVPGVAFGVSADDETAVGAAGDVSAGAVFRVASVTKPFVAALVLTLVQDTSLALDEPVTRYLPELSLPAGPVTLRQLLSHQAGLEHEWSTPLGEYGEGDDALERLARGSPAAVTGPGEWFSYASAGYYIAAAASARVAGTTFEAAMRKRVLEPLGLSRTTFELSEAEGLGLAPGAPLPYPRARRGGGGLFSCVPDLLAFAGHLLGGPGPLNPESLKEMASPQIEAPEGWYGLGLGIRDLRESRIIEHGGSIPGWQSLLLLVPERRFAFVGLSASSRGRKPIDALRDLALATACDLAPEEPERAAVVDTARLVAAAGLYRASIFEVRLAPADGGLRLELAQGDAPVAALASPIGDGVFRVSDGEEEGLQVELLEPGLIRVGGMVARRAD
jgi:CubicO group peptidase (beta-lactamase class C family)